MASALHHHLLLRCLSAAPRRPNLSLSPRPARLRFSVPAPACRLVTHAVALAEPEWQQEEAQVVVVTFYKFVPLEDPRAEVASHLHFLQYSGPRKNAMAYADSLRKDPRFCDMLVQTSPALSGHAFPRLKLRYKPSLVQLEGGSSHLPLVDPSMRAASLTPLEWKERLEARECLDVSSSETSGDTSGRKLLLLDVRNDYEWDIGHFQGAQRPNVDCFRGTSFGLSEEMEDPSDPLNGVDKENTDILMYCTSGIRCDVYSIILRKKGFRNLYTLEGGVSNYLKAEGSAGWVGNLFVFDDRLSLPPATFGPRLSEEAVANGSSSRWVGRCYACGSEVVKLRHRNCANIDCNRLYLCCRWCAEDLGGCCCSECKTAPRLRPFLPGHQRYMKWHVYRDGLLLEAATGREEDNGG